MNDATCSARVPGDNQLRAVQQYLENIKWFFTHLDEWYKEGDEDFAKREGFVRENALKIPMTLRWLANYIGGFSIRYTEKGNFYDFVPKARQKEVLSYCLSIVKDISWIDVPDFEKQVGLRESQSFMTSWGVFNQLVSRVEQLFFSEEKNKGGYTAQEFSEDIDREVWKPTREGRKLTPMEKNMQQAFLGCIASSAEVAGVPQRAGVPAQMSLQTPREWVLPVHYAASVYPGTMNVFPEVFPESVYMKELFVPALETLQVSRYPMEHLYFDMLLKARELIQRASVTGHPEGRILLAASVGFERYRAFIRCRFVYRACFTLYGFGGCRQPGDCPGYSLRPAERHAPRIAERKLMSVFACISPDFARKGRTNIPSIFRGFIIGGKKCLLYFYQNFR